MANLGNRVGIQRLWVKQSTDGGQAGSTYIDMVNWEGCLFLLAQGATQQATTGSIKIRSSSEASTGDAYVYTNSSAGARYDSSGWSSLAFDCYRPLKRYLSVQPAMTSGSMFGYAICYGGRRQGSTEVIPAKTMRQLVTVAMTS